MDRNLFDLVITAVRVHADIFRQDLRHTARSLRRSPGFTVTAIVVAALGIGAPTAVFSMVDHVLVRPLPFPDSGRLVRIEELETSTGYSGELSPANYRDWKRMTTSYEAMGTYRGLSVNLVGQGDPEHLDGASVSAGLLEELGTRPALGRLFTEEDDRTAAPGMVLLSYSLWQGLFGGDTRVLVQRVVLDDTPYTIVGVMPRNFYFPNRECEIWTPMRFAPQDFEDRTNTYIHVIYRRQLSARHASGSRGPHDRDARGVISKALAHTTFIPSLLSAAIRIESEDGTRAGRSGTRGASHFLEGPLANTHAL